MTANSTYWVAKLRSNGLEYRERGKTPVLDDSRFQKQVSVQEPDPGEPDPEIPFFAAIEEEKHSFSRFPEYPVCRGFHHAFKLWPDLHKVCKPELLLLLLTKCRGYRKVEYLDTLLGILRNLVFPADLPGHFQVFFY